MRLVFLGPPGAGKGTQAQVLSQRLKVQHVSTGDILRRAVKDGDPVGLKAKGYMDRGELVPDDIVIRIAAARLAQPDMSAGFILDGFPRTRAQAEGLDRTLSDLRININLVIYFKTSEDIIIQRLSGRRACSVCGTNYHAVNIPPRKPGVCDKCGGNLYLRDDDKEETVRKLLKVYETQTADLIRYYQDKGILREIDGNLEVEDSFHTLSLLFKTLPPADRKVYPVDKREKLL